MKITPSIPKGTRDFASPEIYKRQFIANTIKYVYELFGFDPIETPTMEKLNVLTGKYGDEGDQLLFKVLNNGRFLDKVKPEDLQAVNYASITQKIAEKGLRYDLTVPFARYVAQHRNEITFPFKRYQMQLVWRGDRPQSGRYREFMQCDADVIGSNSLIAESEFLQIYNHVFRRLNLRNKVIIRMNHRKLLAGIAELIGASEQMQEMTVAIDKLDKIGVDGVIKELEERGFQSKQIDDLFSLIEQPIQTIDELEQNLGKSELASEAITDFREIFNNLEGLTVDQSRIQIDISLARGLTYYTGTIFEVIVEENNIGSISGGGRYDDLTEIFGFKDMSGVGISFGLDRIYDVMEQLNLWPKSVQEKKTASRALVTYMDERLKPKVVDFMEKLRFNGVNAEMYLTPTKLAKQFKYANDKGIPFVIVIGQDEVDKGEYQLKFMDSGQQQYLAPAYIINALKPRR